MIMERCIVLNKQLNLVDKNKKLLGTFSLNEKAPIHRWFNFSEGYSNQFIKQELSLIEQEVKSIYDPFSGTGTTPLVASKNGIKSYYSETNPFMAFVCDTKINTSFSTEEEKEQIIEQLEMLLENIKLPTNIQCNSTATNIDYDGFEKYFDLKALYKLLTIKRIIKETCIVDRSRNLALLALASITVKNSKMIRRGDLRFANEKEIQKKEFNVFHDFEDKIKVMISDLINQNDVSEKTHFISEDARNAVFPEKIDCVITSPPYLNGTNYIRNTKLELKLLDFIQTEKDLPNLHSKGIMAGINGVSKRRKIPFILEEIRPYLERLEPVSYDRRIPIMISGYFYDMNIVIKQLSNNLNEDGIFILDIGDSQFAGVHIPTHDVLKSLAEKHGFRLYDEEILRTRRSKNQMILSQRVLRFKLEKN